MIGTVAFFDELRQFGFIHINCGAGSEISIRGLAETVARAVGFSGEIVFDTSKPDGTPRKLMDSSRIPALGWKSEISLDERIAGACRWTTSSPTRRANLRRSLDVANEPQRLQ